MSGIDVTVYPDDNGCWDLSEGGATEIPMALWLRYRYAKRQWEAIRKEIEEFLHDGG